MVCIFEQNPGKRVPYEKMLLGGSILWLTQYHVHTYYPYHSDKSNTKK